MLGRCRTSCFTLAWMSVLALSLVVARHATGQPSRPQTVVASLDAAGLVTLLTRCGQPEPLDESLELVRRHTCSRGCSVGGKVLAFEENRWFIYALAEVSHGLAAQGDNRQQADGCLRRVFLLKPSTLVVQDMVRSPGRERTIRWTLRTAAEPKTVGNRFRVTEANTDILGETLLPDDATLTETARPARGDRPAGFRVEVTAEQTPSQPQFLHVLHFGRNAALEASASPKAVDGENDVELTVASEERVFRLMLPADGSVAGRIEITAADGTALVANRLLPSGVMPHGPKGSALMERWDAPYRRKRLPGWDIGRPCSHLVEAIDDKTFKPGRAIVFGCGSGTNAIYLASRGFEVTGVDVSPSALAIAAEKAAQAGVAVNWMLADVVSLPELPPYDLVFDRGCYHHVCQYDSPGYVETLRQLCRPGTRAIILAGRPAEGSRGGPPRIPEQIIREDFSALFDFVWLREIRFDSRSSDANGSAAWSIHLCRKVE